MHSIVSSYVNLFQEEAVQQKSRRSQQNEAEDGQTDSSILEPFDFCCRSGRSNVHVLEVRIGNRDGMGCDGNVAIIEW